LAPLTKAGLLPQDYPLSIHAVSGYSGGGRAAVELYEGVAPEHAPAFQVYGLTLKHKHVPEIQHYARLSEPPIFLPAYGAYRQGIVLSVPLQQRLLPFGVNAAALHACLTEHYAESKNVRVRSLISSSTQERLDPQYLNGTNDMEFAVFSNPEHGQVLLTAVFDNLGKGAAGAAVQNLDLMLGTS
jgi:N-acetyl-gamma-glutamyl-phosphate reductase